MVEIMNIDQANTDVYTTIKKFNNFFLLQNETHGNYEFCVRKGNLNITTQTNLNTTSTALFSMIELFFIGANKILWNENPWVTSWD